jgi:hypothetical protein
MNAHTTHPTHKNPPDTDQQHETAHKPTQATSILKLNEPPNMEDIPFLCHKAISSIINKANRKLMDKLRKKEDFLYKNSPKRYHANLKTSAGLQPIAKDQPNLATIRDPKTHEITSQPQAIIYTIQSYYEQEHSRTTPDNLPTPQWQNPSNSDPCETKLKDPNKTQYTLDHYLTRGHYTMAYHKASTGKAPGPDALPNEIIKFLPVIAHDLIFNLFQLMARHSCKPKKWSVSATRLIYKPSKTDAHNPANYRPIALMNCILKLWTSILTILGT